MPAPHLFPIDEIDLDATPMVHQEGIAELIPHRGDMLLLEEVIWHDDTFTKGVGRHRVRDDEFWCPGHVPTLPIMPGVLLVETGAQLAAYLYYRFTPQRWFAGFTRIEETAFRGQVVPGDDLLLLCDCLKRSEKRFVCRIQGLVDSEVRFDSLITGMAFPKSPQPPRVPVASVPRTGGQLSS